MCMGMGMGMGMWCRKVYSSFVPLRLLASNVVGCPGSRTVLTYPRGGGGLRLLGTSGKVGYLGVEERSNHDGG